jgi:hypothetical protein
VMADNTPRRSDRLEEWSKGRVRLEEWSKGRVSAGPAQSKMDPLESGR